MSNSGVQQGECTRTAKTCANITCANILKLWPALWAFTTHDAVAPTNIAAEQALRSHPPTNGMVERFDGRITDVAQQTRFTSAAQLEATLTNYAKTYNNQIPQRALNHLSPVQALKNCQSKRPKLFVKRVKDHPGLDT